jgi:RNA polymerase sigma-70 factor (ECF subfamily)
VLYFQQLLGAIGVSSINWCTCSSVMKDPHELNDEKALALAAQGDQEAFGVLYERYVGRIYNYIYYRTGNQHDAEDLTAKVFIRALRHIENYTDRGLPFSAWLYRIAHNLVANWHRDNSRRKEVPLEDTIWIHYNSDHPEAALLHNEEKEGLLLVIRNLPEDRQHLLILKFVEHLSNAEIGLVMGVPKERSRALPPHADLAQGWLFRVKQNGSGTYSDIA